MVSRLVRGSSYEPGAGVFPFPSENLGAEEPKGGLSSLDSVTCVVLSMV